MLNSKDKKRGQFFEIDAIIAIAILVVGIVIIKYSFLSPSNVQLLERYSDDSVDYLKTTKMSDLPAETLQRLESIDIKYLKKDNTLAQQIATYLIKRQELLDQGTDVNQSISILVGAFTNNSNNIDYCLKFGTDLTYPSGCYQHIALAKDVSTTKTMITGLGQDKPIEGELATLKLKNAKGMNSEYIFFGGFVGQGKLNYTLNLPADAAIDSMYIEGSFGGNLSFYVNNDTAGPCEIINVTTPGEFASKETGCKLNLIRGKNNISINFTNETAFTEQYIGGGYIRIKFRSLIYAQANTNIIRKKIVSVQGLINLYDSLTIPGTINSIKFRLHYKNNMNTKLLLYLADKKLLEHKALGDSIQNITISKDVPDPFTEEELISFSNKTVPFVFTSEATGSTAADIALVTDMSNSMRVCMGVDRDVPKPLSESPDIEMLFDFDDPLSGSKAFDKSNNHLDLKCDSGLCPNTATGIPFSQVGHNLFGNAFSYCDDCLTSDLNVDSLYSTVTNSNLRKIKINTYNDWSLGFWFKVNGNSPLANKQVMISDFDQYGSASISGGSRGYRVQIDPGLSTIKAETYAMPFSSPDDGTAHVTLIANNGATLNDGKFHHLSWTRELIPWFEGQISERHILYLDGQPLDQVIRGVNNTESIYMLSVGSKEGAGDTATRFKGTIEDLAVYNKTLTAEEIFAQANGYAVCSPDFEQKENLDPSLKLWWSFDDRYGYDNYIDRISGKYSSIIASAVCYGLNP